MRNKNLFENENVKLRLINLEYSYKERFASENTNEVKKAKEDFVADVRRIYKEETNKELPKNIKIYTSKEILQNKDSSVKRSGYDGTAIYIQDKTHDTNQLQIISQGSADNEDWVYNFSGLFLGMDDSQYKATKEFTIETKKKTQDVKSLNTYAMGQTKC